MVELMLMQNAQMHQIIMHNMMLKAMPPMLPAGGPSHCAPQTTYLGQVHTNIHIYPYTFVYGFGPLSHQTTKFLFLYVLLKSDKDDSVRILIMFFVIFTSHSAKSACQSRNLPVYFKKIGELKDS